MHELNVDVLLELIAAASEPLAVVHLDSPDWPVVLTNPAFDTLSGNLPALERPFPDVLEPMIGREMTREASGVMRSGDTVSLPVDVGSREFLLLLLPVPAAAGRTAGYYAAYWRTAGQQPSPGRSQESVRALAGATRRIRARAGDDPVTGLMNEAAFRDVLEHDWAVAAREDTTLGLIVFRPDDFAAYVAAFGRQGADSCLRRIATIVSRSLRRASDVAANIEAADGSRIVVLSHGSSEAGLEEFAGRIAAAIRNLGLHHPRSTVAKFLTVSHRTEYVRPRGRGEPAAGALSRLLAG